jgi:flagellar hook-associated protein 2
MGSISTGVGLLSGIDTASLIESLLAIDQRGKIPIQIRLAQLSTAKSALLDVNSRLLALKTASSAFRLDNVFKSVLATSSNAEQVGVTATGNPTPGSYSLLVKQLASSSQFLSSGFASRDASPLGLDQLQFELGNGRLRDDFDLANLNGGAGINRGRIEITDRTGESAEIDLSEATTINEVIAAINGADTIQIEASTSDGRLVLTDLSGGAGSIRVEDGIGSSTASDLGIDGISATSTLVGDRVNTIGVDTALSSLNDGRGVLIRNGVSDFVIEINGVDYDIDLGRVDAPITGETLLEKLNGGNGVSINDDPEQGDLEIVTSTGQVITVDLGRTFDEDGLVQQDAVETVQELIDRVNGTLADELGAGSVTLTLNADANGFSVTDTLGGVSELEVRGSGPGSSATAEDLGILGAASGGVLAGSVLRNEVQTARAETVGDLQARILEATGGLVEIGFDGAGTGITFDGLGQSITLKSGSPGYTGDPADIPDRTLNDLGFKAGEASTNIPGRRVLSSMGSVLVGGLLGGQGLRGADSITITDKAGNSTVITGLSSQTTLDGLMESINTSLSDAGVGVRIDLGPAGTGVAVTDSSGGGGSLAVSGDLATELGIDATTAETSIEGDNLQLQYVNQSSSLSDLNYGRGIGTGSFRLTDSTGATSTINITNDLENLHDVIKVINTRGLEIRAEINPEGDGLVLVDTALENGTTSVSSMKVDDLSGATASGLRIAGEADVVGGNIDGSYAVTIDLDPNDTMDDLIAKLADQDAPVTATVLNTGSGSRPYFLSFTSSISGRAGDLVIDSGGVDLGLDELVQARDAKAFLGSADPASALLVSSSTNELSVIDGLRLDLLSVGSEPVTINVQADDESVVASVQSFVDAFNDVVGRIGEYDSYDQDSEVRGPLLGDPTAARVRSSLYATLQGKALAVEGPYQYLSQVGITIGTKGVVEFDESRFNDAWATDPDGVEALFATFDSQSSSTEEISPGITVERSSTYYPSLGFGDLFDQLLDGLTDPFGGTLNLADERFQSLIDSQTERLERIDERMQAKRGRLQRQFAAMESVLAQLQGQQGALMGLSSNLAMAGIR